MKTAGTPFLAFLVSAGGPSVSAQESPFEDIEGYNQFHVAPIQNQYDVCTDFCKGALSVCDGVVDWVTDTYAVPLTRHGQGGDVFDRRLKMTRSEKISKAKSKIKSYKSNKAEPKPYAYDAAGQFPACHDTCMGWIYHKQQAFPNPAAGLFNGYAIGDSLNCRFNHLMFASGFPGTPDAYGLKASESESAAQHCQHITNDGAWVCTDYRNEEGKTPAQLYRAGTMTKHRLGDCFLAADDTIADCHRKGLDDTKIAQNLLWLPDKIQYIFLNNNRLTEVPDLSRFTQLKGVYFQNNNITTLHSDAFVANTKLEIIEFGNNKITALPEDILATLTNLKAFFCNFNLITEVPERLFRKNEEIEMISVVDNRLTSFKPNTFKGLHSLQLLAFGQQGGTVLAEGGGIFKADGIPPGLFDDLVSLEYFSVFISGLEVLPKSWFGSWSAKIESIAIFQNPLGSIEDGVFELLPGLIDFGAYTSGVNISPDDVATNTKLKILLYGSQFDINASNP